jgi:O-antigen/teichoic acid export membrane protein
MKPRASRLGGQMALYGIGGVAKHLSSLVMLPIYTFYLSPADYGAIEIITLILSSASLVAGMNLGEGLFRFFHQPTDKGGGRHTVSTALALAVLLGAVGAILLSATAPWLADRFLTGNYPWTYIAIASLTLMTEACASIVVCHMRAEGDAMKYFWAGMLRLALQIGLNVYFLVVLDLGVLGILLGGLAATLTLSIVVLPYTLRRVGWSYSALSARQLFAFGGPLVVANAATFYLGASDRFFIEHYQGLAAVGVYALAARLAAGFGVLIYDPFEQMWDPEKYRIWHSTRDTAVFQCVFRLLSLVLIVTAAGVSVFAPEIFGVLTSAAFADAAYVAPILIASAVFYALSRFVRFGSLVSGKTANVYQSAVVSALVLTVLLWLLTPPYGIVGAALSTALASGFRLVVDERLARKHVDLHLSWVRFTLLGVLAVLVVSACSFFSAMTIVGVALKLLVLLALAAGAWWSPFLLERDRQLVRQLIAPRRASG